MIEMIEPKVMINPEDGTYVMSLPDGMKGGPIVGAPTYWECYEKYKEAYQVMFMAEAIIEYEKVLLN